MRSTDGSFFRSARCHYEQKRKELELNRNEEVAMEAEGKTIGLMMDETGKFEPSP